MWDCLGQHVVADVTRLVQLQSTRDVWQKLQRVPASLATFGIGRLRAVGNQEGTEEALGAHDQYNVDRSCEFHEATDHATATSRPEIVEMDWRNHC